MRRFTISLAAASLSFAFTPHALAYLTPEQVLEEDQYGSSQPLTEDYYHTAVPVEEEEPYQPSGLRAYPRTASYRVQESKGPHSTLKKYAPQEEISEEEPTHESAPTLEEEPTAAGPTINLDARTIRLLERLSQPRQTVITLQAGSNAPTHSGAPLAPTGAGTVVAMIAMLAAIGWTIRKARAAKF